MEVFFVNTVIILGVNAVFGKIIILDVENDSSDTIDKVSVYIQMCENKLWC